jgi:cleavage stimulation factor subunit 3
MSARAVLKELRLRMPLSALADSSQDLPQNPSSLTSKNPKLASTWRRYLEWEETNPLGIQDHGDLLRRLRGVYRKAVIKMKDYVEIW